ncbi:hypothetical protein ACJA3G_37025, partial [Streptomyces sp. YS-3]
PATAGGTGPSAPPPGTTGGTAGTSGGTGLVTHVNGPGEGPGGGSLAGTGAATTGWLLVGAGVLGAAGIAAVHYAPRRIRGESDDTAA